MAAGLTQAQLAGGAGVSQQVVSDAERGDPDVSLEIRCRLTAACGHELGWRLHPVATVSLRDSGQLAIVRAIVLAAHPNWKAEIERPVGPGRLRAADLVLAHRDELVHIEVERALVDVQAQLRAAQVKRAELARADPRPIRLVIALPETRLSRRRLAPISDLISHTLPMRSREIWHAIRRGVPVRADGILFVRPERKGIFPSTRPGPLPQEGARP
jgi:transcriptional regulator with XRE-family HTH domain